MEARLLDEAFFRKLAPLKAALAARALALRGVTVEEIALRLSRAQRLLTDAQLDGVLLTTEPDSFYFTGLASRFWISPTRPFFLLIPREGSRPVAVVPTIIAHDLNNKTWLGSEGVRTWPGHGQIMMGSRSSPRPLVSCLSSLVA